jgi:hypothetical protein
MCVRTVYVNCVRCTLFPLWLKSEPVWPAISVSIHNSFVLGKKFGLGVCLQLASRVREGGGVGQLCLHGVTQPYTTWPRWREQGGGLHSLPLGERGSVRGPGKRDQTIGIRKGMRGHGVSGDRRGKSCGKMHDGRADMR